MEPATVESTAHTFADARRVLSNCWIYTPDRGLRAVTMHGNGSSLAVDGQRLQRWMIVDEQVPGAIVAYLYSSDRPAAELRAEVIRMARSRFMAADRS